jgi:hypothetical protein
MAIYRENKETRSGEWKANLPPGNISQKASGKKKKKDGKERVVQQTERGKGEGVVGV